MNYAEIMRAFASSKDYPAQAVDAALKADDTLITRFIGVLKRARTPAVLTDQEVQAIFLIIHVLAERRETRAFEPMMGMLSGDPEFVYDALGDSLTEHLTAILIAIYDGDVARLEPVILNPKLDDSVRSSALSLWTYLALTGDIETDYAKDFLTRLRHVLEPGLDDFIWSTWADAIADLQLTDLAPMVAEADAAGGFGKGDFRIMDYSHFEERLNDARAATNRLHWMREKGYEPYGRTEDAVADWFGRDDEDSGYVPETSDDPDHPAFLDSLPKAAENRYRDVGRNDPCPCGSGKKFKKCCLQAG